MTRFFSAAMPLLTAAVSAIAARIASICSNSPRPFGAMVVDVVLSGTVVLVVDVLVEDEVVVLDDVVVDSPVSGVVSATVVDVVDVVVTNTGACVLAGESGSTVVGTAGASGCE